MGWKKPIENVLENHTKIQIAKRLLISIPLLIIITIPLLFFKWMGNVAGKVLYKIHKFREWLFTKINA